MGNGNVTGANGDQKQKTSGPKSKQFGDSFHRKKTDDNLIFYACTDKARVITEILEERGWSRTKDQDVTNYTIKWCLEHQVDWKKFKEGKQLINNIPGQITFADKVNLWYTIRDYLNSRRNEVGNNIQTFLPMTFILDEEDEIAEFLRVFKKQNRTWIHKPRYSYAGQGIHVISGNSDLETIFKIKASVGNGNRVQHQAKQPGYLIQEYIARPLLIKGRKFDMRVHWLVGWTKPLLIFYNHHASVVRLSLNLYREFDFDRATHLTNLSIQEHHYRYAFSQEATGMTMHQLNAYFNQCFRPFHPNMCQDWVMTVLQDRMKTIIRQVVRASKNKLERTAGQFGLFGCDFLLDENFRLWLLEVNDNPGVGWGNTQVNYTTKPLFEETLDIVLECFEKHKRSRSLLPIECLKNYQLIYDENNDNDNLSYDDNQVFSERSTARQSREVSVRSSATRTSASRTSTTTSTIANSDIIVPLTNETNISKNIVPRERKESNIPVHNYIDYARLSKIKDVKARYTFRISSHSLDKLNIGLKRALSSDNTMNLLQRKRYVHLKPIFSDKKNSLRQSKALPAITMDDNAKSSEIILEEDESEQQESSKVPITTLDTNINGHAASLCAVN